MTAEAAGEPGEGAPASPGPRGGRWRTSALAAIAVNGGTRVLGLVREVYISGTYGATRVTDAFFAVQQVPVFVSSYMSGAFNLAFVPAYAQASKHGHGRALLLRALRWSFLPALAVAVLLFLAADRLVPSLVGQAGNADVPPVARIVVWSLPAFVLTGLAAGLLIAEGKAVRGLLISAAGSIVALSSLVLVRTLDLLGAGEALALSFVVGAVVSAGLAVWPLAQGLRQEMAAAVTGAARRTRGFVAATLENIGFNVNQMLNVVAAGLAGAGAVTTYFYAARLAMAPLGVVISPINQVMQGELGRSTQDEAGRAFRRRALMLAGVAAGMALLIILLRGPIVETVYARGRFTDADSAKLQALLVPFGIYLFVMAMNQTFARYYFHLGRGTTYAGLLLSGYGVANAAKFPMAKGLGIAGVLWANVLGEGLALVGLVALVRRAAPARPAA